MEFITSRGREFLPLPNTPPPAYDSLQWWHGISNPKYPQALETVTHLGDEQSARARLEAQKSFGASELSLNCVELPSGLSVMPQAYLEVVGSGPMSRFEKMLDQSKFDIAFTWNLAESNGSWNLIIKRDVIGDIPAALSPGFTMVSSAPYII